MRQRSNEVVGEELVSGYPLCPLRGHLPRKGGESKAEQADRPSFPLLDLITDGRDKPGHDERMDTLSSIYPSAFNSPGRL